MTASADILARLEELTWNEISSDVRTVNLLRGLIGWITPEVIVEAGTYHGTSAICMAASVIEQGLDTKIYTAEIVKEYYDAAKENIAKFNVEHVVVPYLGSFENMIKPLKDINLAYIDGGIRAPMIIDLEKRMAPYGIIVIDDIGPTRQWKPAEDWLRLMRRAALVTPYGRQMIVIQVS